MRTLVACFVLFAVFGAALPVPAAQAQTGPTETMRQAVDDILTILRDSDYDGEDAKNAQREALKERIAKMFAWDQLSMRAVGAHWKKFSDQEKEQFQDAFATLLGNTYLDRIQAYTDEKVEFTGERDGNKGKVEVQTKVVTDTKEIPLHYRVTETPDGWRVYDVIIEGVSLVKNYRSQFNEMLIKGSPADVIANIQSKNTK